LVADSILTNILHEEDHSLDPVKCSFLSYLFEVCWDATPENECRPSVDKNMKQVAHFYRSHCLPNSCFALFFMTPEIDHRIGHHSMIHHANETTLMKTESGSQAVTTTVAPRHLEKIPSTLCSNQFQSLLQVLLNPDCKQPHEIEQQRLENKMTEFKDCAERHSSLSCRNETTHFMNNFIHHMQQRNVCWLTSLIIVFLYVVTIRTENKSSFP
jgi:hypothetical protein